MCSAFSCLVGESGSLVGRLLASAGSWKFMESIERSSPRKTIAHPTPDLSVQRDQAYELTETSACGKGDTESHWEYKESIGILKHKVCACVRVCVCVCVCVRWVVLHCYSHEDMSARPSSQ